MKAAIWEAVFAALSPSPVLVAVAEFAKARVDQKQSAALEEIAKTLRSLWAA